MTNEHKLFIHGFRRELKIPTPEMKFIRTKNKKIFHFILVQNCIRRMMKTTANTFDDFFDMITS